MSGNRESDRFGERLSGWHYSLGWGDGSLSVAPYVPTPKNVVEYMLKLVKAGPGDILYDLGCGDGRILFTAVEVFGVDKAVGYELNNSMVEGVQRKILEKNMNNRVEVYHRNFFDVDLSPASVITLYLTTSGNSKLKPKFRQELRPGTRIISHDFPIQEWGDLQSEKSPYVLGSHKIFHYSIPKNWGHMVSAIKQGNRWKRIKERLFGS